MIVLLLLHFSNAHISIYTTILFLHQQQNKTVYLYFKSTYYGYGSLVAGYCGAAPLTWTGRAITQI